MGADFLAWLIEGTLATSVAVLLVMVLRRPVRGWFGAEAAYALWGLVPAAMLAVSLPPLARGGLATNWAAPTLAVEHASDAVAAAAPAGLPLLGAWLAGALLVVLLQAWRQRAFVRGLGPLQQRPDGLAQSLCTRGLPAVLGLRPRIVLPGDFEQRYAPLERELVLEHERVHLRRGDVAMNALAAALRVLFWFNPLVHRAVDVFRHDQELSCDAIVVRRHPGRRRAYGDAMLKTELAGQRLPLGCHWSGIQPLKERMMMLKSPLSSPVRLRAGRLLAAGIVLGLSTLAWASQPAGAPRGDNMDVAGIQGQAPAYPKAAADAGQGGMVMLKVRVGTDGSAREVQFVADKSTVAADSEIARNSIDAAATWTFKPQLQDGKPVEAWVLVPVKFEPPAAAAPEA